MRLTFGDLACPIVPQMKFGWFGGSIGCHALPDKYNLIEAEFLGGICRCLIHIEC